jgi:hypothetical protein
MYTEKLYLNYPLKIFLLSHTSKRASDNALSVRVPMLGSAVSM